MNLFVCEVDMNVTFTQPPEGIGYIHMTGLQEEGFFHVHLASVKVLPLEARPGLISGVPQYWLHFIYCYFVVFYSTKI